MPRKAWMFAMGGVTLAALRLSTAAEPPAGTLESETATPRRSMFFSAHPDAPETETQPVRYERTAPPEGGRNYYSELFSASTPNAARSAPSPTRSATDARPFPAVTPVEAVTPADAATPTDDVIHAKFEQNPFETGSQIEQVVAPAGESDLRDARPFPGIDSAPERTRGVTITRRSPASTFAPSTAASASSSAATASSNAVATPNVSVEWVKRGLVNVGQECTCDLVLRNSGNVAAHEIDVAAEFPANVKLVAADPAPVSSQERLTWRFDQLAPGGEQVIHVRLIPLESGPIQTAANVRFSTQALGAFEVGAPQLAIRLDGPASVLVGEAASQTLTISNPGTGVATNVQVEAIIPRGLEHAKGERLVMEVGSLNPGESRTVRLSLATVAGGVHTVLVNASGEGNLLQSSTAKVEVIAPSLTAEIAGPGLRYLGRQATYALTVANDGAVPTDNVRVMHKLPEGFEFVSADKGAQFDKTTGLLNWFVGRLDQGQTAQINVTLSASQIGEFTHFIRVTSEQGTVSDAQTTTRVEGASSLVLKVTDLDDPVETGSETAYEIQVRNEGSAPARGVAVSCELPAGVAFGRTEGPSESIAEKDLVVFRPIEELAAGQSVTLRVFVKGSVPGNLRFRARLSSESISEPLTTEELTRFYGE